MKNPITILYDVEGNPIGVQLDDTVYRLAVTGKIQKADGTTINPATEETLAALKDSGTLDTPDLLKGILSELTRIRALMEVLTDEEVGEHEADPVNKFV